MRLADRYVFERRVGEGGGGGVVLVRDRLAGDARMALKRLHTGAHASLAQWLVNEFQVLARLSLPTVARVHDFGLASPDGDDPGGPYFTRAFVDGNPLDECFRTRPDRIASLLTTLLATLRALHGAGVVHGDLKPANVIVSPSGEALTLIDFGLAHGAFATRSHTAGGTLAFLPPERRAALLAGERLPPDPRADLYAVCATVLVSLGLEDDDAPVPDALTSVVTAARRGVASDPSRRYATADDLGAAMLGARDLALPGAVRVVPRPEGREHELGVLLEEVSRVARREGAGSSVLLAGAHGTGRTTLLDEIAWRAGLRGVTVLRLDARADALARLRTAADVLGGAEGDLVTRMRRAAQRGAILVLADDCDRDVAGVLRTVVYACEPGESLLVVATSTDESLANELGAPRVVNVAPLDVRAVEALCAQVLGPIEPGVAAAVLARTTGVAARVEAMLVALAASGGVTVGDVERVPEAHGRADEPEAVSHEAHVQEAARMDAIGAPADERLRAWTRAGDATRATACVPEALARWRADGLASVAARALGEIDALDAGALGDALQLARADLLVQSGAMRDVVPVALALAASSDGAVASRARLIAGRALVSTGALGEARTVLADGIAHATNDDSAAEMLWETALAELRAGDLARCLARCDEGLARAQSDRVRGGLLALAGLAESYRGAHESAGKHLAEALALVAGESRDEARVLAYTAIARDQAGDLAGARTLTERALERARAASDVGAMASARLNLGGLLDRQGDLAGAMDHYRVAARLAEQSARPDTALAAQLNLAGDLLRLGALARARTTLDEVHARAVKLGYRETALHADAMLGALVARDGDVDDGVARMDGAARAFAALGRDDAAREAGRDVVEALLARGATGDVERAGDRLAAVGGDDARGALLAGWWSLARGGDEARAMERLTHAIGEATAHDEWETLATALGLRGRLHADRGATLHARRDTERALEVLETTASRLPADLRGAFWGVGSRAALRSATGGTSTGALATAGGGELGYSVGFNTVTSGGDARLVLLLALAKRVGEEATLAAVLDRIVQSAVELTHAERSAVLLLEGPRGQDLVVRARSGNGTDDGPDEAFSRSIAETVLVDGEAVSTTNARGDARFADFRSVHELAIGAVAAVPVRVRGRTLGVLYVENRRRRGQWSRGDVAVLEAFADHAGVAVERARLMSELEARTRELEHARIEIETLLAARTAELEDARDSLAKAERALRKDAHGIVGRSDAIRRVTALIERVRDGDVPVVIEGESGTGKELVARAIHDGGARAKGPFVVVHCGAIPETLLESELFGHVKGAFTGAERDRKGLLASAHGGTLLLDEVSEMPLRMQVELLRVLADRRVRPVGSETEESVDFRILAASNRPLADLVAAGRMREDLYYRLAVVTVRVPPLRARTDDVPLLAAHFLTRIARDHSITPRRLSRDALAALARAPWPGNVRQLRHVLESAAVLADGVTIEAGDLGLDTQPAVLAPSAPSVAASASAGEALTPMARRRAAERHRILDALERVQWNKVRAAEVLGMPRRTLYRRLREYGLLE